MIRILTTFLMLSAVVTPLAAQQSADDETLSTIVVTGHASESVSPDGVRIELLVWSLAPSADSASSQTAAKADDVAAALESLGIQDMQLSRVGYRVGPQWDYNADSGRRFEGYSASVRIRIETSALEETGRIVDSGLSSGVRELSSVRYVSSRIDEVRRRALTAAVHSTKQDAEAIAEASGGRLGKLLRFSTGGAPDRLSFTNSLASLETSIELTPEDLRINVNVESHWQFFPDPDAD